MHLLAFFVGIVALATPSEMKTMQQMEQAIDLLNNKIESMEENNKNIKKEIIEVNNNTEERLAHLEEMTKLNTIRTCAEMADFGIAATNYYFVDPDGPLIGSDPFLVFCRFTEDGLSITELLHDSEELIEVSHCEEAACYKHTVTYTAPREQILSLMLLSKECEQTVRYDSLLAPLFSHDTNWGFWVDRHNEANVYWHGAHKGHHVCSCYFEEDGCIESSFLKNTTCNSDADVPQLVQDIGTITNISALPVTELRFGGLVYDMQQAFHAVGRLKCWGKKEYREATSCAALKRSGQFHSGFFNIRKNREDNTQLVFCNQTGTPGYQDGDNEEFVESSEDHFDMVEKEIETVKNDVQDTDGKISTLEKDVSLNKGKISALENDMSVNQGNIFTLRNEVHINQQKVSTLENAVYVNEGEISTLEDDVSVIQGKISTLENDVFENEGKILSLENNVSVNEEKIFTHENEIFVNKGKIFALENDVSINEGKISTLENDTSTIEGKIPTLENGISVNEERISSLENNVSINRENISTLENDVSVNKEHLSTLQNDVSISQGKISNLENDVNFNFAKIYTLENEVSLNKGNISNLNNDVSVNQKNISKLENYVSTNQQNISTLETDVFANEAKISTLENDISVNEGKISTLEANVSVNKGNISSLENYVSVNGEKISTLENAVSTHEGKISALESDVSLNRINISTLENDVLVNGGKISALENGVSVNKGNISTLETYVSVNQGDISTLEDSVSVNDGKISSLENDVSLNKGNISSLDNHVSSLDDDISSLKLKTYFCAYRQYWVDNKTGQVITYNRLFIEDNNIVGASLNISTGEFTAGHTGNYNVDFHIGMMTKRYSNDNLIRLRYNGNQIYWEFTLHQTFDSKDEGDRDIGGRSMMVWMNEGDKIDIFGEEINDIADVTFCVGLAK